MSKVNTYIWNGEDNTTMKVAQLVFQFSPEPEIDNSYMESFGIPLKDGAWREMSYWMYNKPTNWFKDLEPEDKVWVNYEVDGYDLEEEEIEFE
jgi:hypothetical protein